MQLPFNLTVPAMPIISTTTFTSYVPADLKPSRVSTSASSRASTAWKNIHQVGENFIEWSSHSRTIQDSRKIVQLAWKDPQRLTPYAWSVLLVCTLLFVLLIALELHMVKQIFRKDYRSYQRVPQDIQTQQEEPGCLREKEFLNTELQQYDTTNEQEQRDITEPQRYGTPEEQEQGHISPCARLLRSECHHLREIERQIWSDNWQEKAAHIEHAANDQACWAREYVSTSVPLLTCE
ncbi:hypothetical protein MMC28_004039 [Mycoblastus sanguinarius]|nr:hypothetical protein [Mycoblastus sanguinarius]